MCEPGWVSSCVSLPEHIIFPAELHTSELGRTMAEDSTVDLSVRVGNRCAQNQQLFFKIINQETTPRSKKPHSITPLACSRTKLVIPCADHDTVCRSSQVQLPG
jgi:hypothetical protein